MPRKPPAPPAAGDGDDDLEQLRNEYHALLRDLAKAPGSREERFKLAELIREAIADATGPNPAPAQAAQKIVQQTPYMRLGRRLAAANRTHPPLWGAWTMALLLNPVVAVGAAQVGITPPAPPPQQHQAVAAADAPFRRASYRSLPEPDVLRGLVRELSPQALRGLSDEQIATRARSVQQLMEEALSGSHAVFTGPMTSIGDEVENALNRWRLRSLRPDIFGQGGNSFRVPVAEGKFVQAWSLGPWPEVFVAGGRVQIISCPNNGREGCKCAACMSKLIG